MPPLPTVAHMLMCGLIRCAFEMCSKDTWPHHGQASSPHEPLSCFVIRFLAVHQPQGSKPNCLVRSDAAHLRTAKERGRAVVDGDIGSSYKFCRQKRRPRRCCRWTSTRSWPPSPAAWTQTCRCRGASVPLLKESPRRARQSPPSLEPHSPSRGLAEGQQQQRQHQQTALQRMRARELEIDASRQRRLMA